MTDGQLNGIWRLHLTTFLIGTKNIVFQIFVFLLQHQITVTKHSENTKGGEDVIHSSSTIAVIR